MPITSKSDWFSAIALGDAVSVSLASQAFARSVDRDGSTGLMKAAANNQAHICQILAPVEKGLFNASGENALLIAMRAKALTAVAVLAQFEAFYRLRDDATPLHFAVQHHLIDSIPYISALLRDKTDRRGMTALDLAGELGDLGSATTILKYGGEWTPVQLEKAAAHAASAGFHTLANTIRNHRTELQAAVSALNTAAQMQAATNSMVAQLAVGNIAAQTQAAATTAALAASTLTPVYAGLGATDGALLSSRIAGEMAVAGVSPTLNALTASQLGYGGSAATAAQLATTAAAVQHLTASKTMAQAQAQAALTADTITRSTIQAAALQNAALNPFNPMAQTAAALTASQLSLANPLIFPQTYLSSVVAAQAAAQGAALAESARLAGQLQQTATKARAVAELRDTLENIGDTMPTGGDIHLSTTGSKANEENYVFNPDTKRYPNGDTELIVAAKNNDINAVRVLIGQATQVNNRGKTALICATERNHFGCVRELAPRESGMTDYDGMSALMYAASYGLREIVALLIPSEKRLSRPRDGGTALMAAASNGHYECVSQLLEHEQRMQAYDGSTALILAVKFNRRNVAQKLFSAELDISDSFGKTPEDWAAELNRRTILEDIKAYKDTHGIM
ncbi:Ankyrin repeat protein 1 [Giardia muris]|uniref:Ankyrin repeat protein 1 n=1 Tax=Giardia muris TaxID=5742 RepID=A0A4Z1T2V0_GIAMU|nr:Ankyrin repeat protein 1 [Giardia muris]|eukprot:TNJ27387.1 Ankyrin repeat protein 1 [Giardia muris]